jgi:hypothetical protein
MKTKFASTTLFAAVTALGLGIAPAFAAAPSVNSGYKFPDFWGDVAAEHATTATAQHQGDGAKIGAYATQSSHGTWIFPPDANAGANS